MRSNAATELGKIGPKATQAVQILIKAHKDDNNYVREVAAEALKKIRGK